MKEKTHERPISHAAYIIGRNQLKLQEAALQLAVTQTYLREDIISVTAQGQTVGALLSHLESIKQAVKAWEGRTSIRPRTRWDKVRIWVWFWATKERFEGIGVQ